MFLPNDLNDREDEARDKLEPVDEIERQPEERLLLNLGTPLCQEDTLERGRGSFGCVPMFFGSFGLVPVFLGVPCLYFGIVPVFLGVFTPLLLLLTLPTLDVLELLERVDFFNLCAGKTDFVDLTGAGGILLEDCLVTVT